MSTTTATTLPKLYSRTSTGKIQEWQITVDNNTYYVEEGLQGGKQTCTRPTVCGGKNLGRANATDGAEQARREAKAKWEKKVKSGYFTSVGRIDEETFFEPMLAHNWADYKSDVTFPVYVQPKLDGIRCIARKTGLWSRNGKPIVSCPHIWDALKYMFECNPDLILDGELYADKLSNDFNTICSLVKRTKLSAEQYAESEKGIEYWVYDMPGYLAPSAKRQAFKERSRALKELIKFVNPKYVKLVATEPAFSQSDLDYWYETWVEQGYEGQMIRKDEPYENKRSKSLLKRKEFQDEEFKILEVHEGEGNRAGTVGYMVLQLNGADASFRSNVKGSHEYLSELLKDRKKLVGKMATVKFFNWTPDNVPRFPFVIGIRDYE